MGPPDAPGRRLAPAGTADTLRYLIQIEPKEPQGEERAFRTFLYVHRYLKHCTYVPANVPMCKIDFL
jgi:hypothetical protein